MKYLFFSLILLLLSLSATVPKKGRAHSASFAPPFQFLTASAGMKGSRDASQTNPQSESYLPQYRHAQDDEVTPDNLYQDLAYRRFKNYLTLCFCLHKVKFYYYNII